MRAGLDDLFVTRWSARFRGRSFPCALGWGGIRRDKREGDGATPAGAHRLLGGRYRADRLAQPKVALPIRAVGPAEIWSDDQDDPRYNSGLSARFHPFGHERMWRGDGLYDIVIATDWNMTPAQPGAGSAIFVHCWKRARKPTAGCVAFRRRDLIWILAHWSPRSRLIVQP